MLTMRAAADAGRRKELPSAGVSRAAVTYCSKPRGDTVHRGPREDAVLFDGTDRHSVGH